MINIVLFNGGRNPLAIFLADLTVLVGFGVVDVTMILQLPHHLSKTFPLVLGHVGVNPLHPKILHELRPRHPQERCEGLDAILFAIKFCLLDRLLGMGSNLRGTLAGLNTLAPLRVEVPLHHEIEIKPFQQSLTRSLRMFNHRLSLIEQPAGEKKGCWVQAAD